MESTTEIGTITHPRSGDLFAVKVQFPPEDQPQAKAVILEAAGPMHYDDSRDEESLYGWLSNNSVTATEDGSWLDGEFAEFPFVFVPAL